MKEKKVIATFLALILVLSILTACSSGSAPGAVPDGAASPAASDAPDKVYQWRFQSTENESVAMFNQRNEICQKIAEETNGGLIITQYGGGAIISDMNIPDAVMTRTIEMGNVYLNPLYAMVPSSNIIGILPGFLYDVGDCMLYLNGYGAMDEFKKECEEILNCYVYGELTGRVMYLSTKEVHEVSDFAGMQIKAYGPLGNIFTKLGASVVNLSSSEIYTSLQTGLVNMANWGAYEGAVGASLHEVCKYFVEPCLGIGLGTVDLINKDAYDELPVEYQRVVDKYFSTRMWDSVRETDAAEFDARQTMVEAGLTPCKLSDACISAFQEMAMEEIEALKSASPACEAIYNDLMTFMEYQRTLDWN